LQIYEELNEDSIGHSRPKCMRLLPARYGYVEANYGPDLGPL
jgi:hypothetical protein